MSLEDQIKHLTERAPEYVPCMSLDVSTEGKSVELILDNSIPFYLEWIPGEGGDIGLLRSRETGRVVGCHLPLMNNRLAVFHNSEIKVNDGVLKNTQPERNP